MCWGFSHRVSSTPLTLKVPIPCWSPCAWGPFTARCPRQPRLPPSALSRYVLLLRGATFNLIVSDLISSPRTPPPLRPDWIKSNCAAWLQHAVDKCNTDGSNNFFLFFFFFGGARSMMSWNRKGFFFFSLCFIFAGAVSSSRSSLCWVQLCVVTLKCPGLIFLFIESPANWSQFV